MQFHRCIRFLFVGVFALLTLTYTPVAAQSVPQDGSSNAEVFSAVVTRALTGTLQVHTMPRYVTAPDLASQVTITKTDAPLAEGYLFAAPFWIPNPQAGRYWMIFDDNANLVYYKRRASNFVMDFKVQSNGYLSYFDADDNSYKVLDQSYQLVSAWRAGNGYTTDNHEFLLLPNGHALLMVYAPHTVDLSPYGGAATATVISLVIQEVDQQQNVYFEWDSIDHIPVTDTNQPLTSATVDYIHGNALAVDTDGNILISSRHLSEITKIERTTGNIIWRLGGKQNQFQFIGDPTLPGVGAFSYQHDIRRLPNGNISVMDNGNDFMDASLRGSRGVEYQLDEANKTATLVREFRTTPDVKSYYMGNTQFLVNGNVMVGWGGGSFAPFAPPSEAMTEFTADGQVAMSVNYAATPFVSYRAFRFPWQGFPTEPPALVAMTDTLPIKLYYSWNGATEVVSYTVEGGATPASMAAFALQPKTGFEEMTTLDQTPEGTCFFRVTPFDKTGQPNRPSDIVYLGDAACPSHLTVGPAEPARHAIPLPNAAGPATITVDIAAGAVMSPTIVAVTSAAPPISALPAGKVAAGLYFKLSAHGADDLASAAALAGGVNLPVQLEIEYRNLPAPHVTTLSVAIWDQAQGEWSSAGITLLANDTLHHKLTVAVPGPGVYALLADNAVPASADTLALTNEDTPYRFRPGDFTFYDSDGDPLQAIVIASGPLSGTLSFAGAPIDSGQVITTGAIAQLVYAPPPDASGVPFTTFGFRVSDGFGVSPVYTATLLVQPVNDAPVARDDVLIVPAGNAAPQAVEAKDDLGAAVPAQLAVLANDFDVDGDRLRIAAVSTPAHGSVALAGDIIIYTPGLSYGGTDEFTYTVTDDRGGEAVATVTVTAAGPRIYLPHIRAQQ